MKQEHLDLLSLLSGEYQNIRLKLVTDKRRIERLSIRSLELFGDESHFQGLMDQIDRDLKNVEQVLVEMKTKIRIMDTDYYA
jgi:hypothetical protein